MNWHFDQDVLERSAQLFTERGYLLAAEEAETLRKELFQEGADALGALILQAQRAYMEEFP